MYRDVNHSKELNFHGAMMAAVVSLGEALFDLFASPSGSSLANAEKFTPTPGGAPANVAIGLARLGIDVGFVGRVGDDSFGAQLLDLLQAEGVDTVHCLRVAGVQTTIALAAALSPVQQEFILFRGADILLRPEHLDRDYLTEAKVLVCGSVTLSADGCDAMIQAVRWARNDGVIVAFDVNYRPAVWSSDAIAREKIMTAMGFVDVVKLNKAELLLLSGTGDLQRGSRRILGFGVKLCLITLGSDGAYFDNGSVRGHVHGFDTEVIDTTGCGDAFLSAFIGGLVASDAQLKELTEARLHELIQIANASGALNASRRGAIPGLPTRAEIDQLLSKSVS